MVKAHAAAVAAKSPASPELTKRYGSLFGSILHAVKYRPEIAASMSLLGQCLTFATEELYTCMKRVLIYLARSPNLGTTFTGKGDGAAKLVAYADSNWGETRSTTGYVVKLANGTVSAASRRQHCISMSSCEAELYALAECAIELLQLIGVINFIGHELELPVQVYTDNKAAYDLCHRYTSAQNTRHIQRRLFKMRELRGEGVVAVNHIPTELNPADLFTKILPRATFERHRSNVLNTSGAVAIESLRKANSAKADKVDAAAKSTGRVD